MVYTSYFGNIKNLPKDAILVSIARWTPKWFKGYKFPELAPKVDLLKWWKNSNQTEEDLKLYKKIYNGYLGQKSCLMIYTQLISAAKDKDIILLCYERPSEFCHRQLVREWFNNNGFKCEEV